MIALQIKSLKTFMNTFLASDAFDIFLLEAAVICTANTYTIDGRQNKEFYSEDEWNDTQLRPYDYTCWKELRGLCFELIKGNHTPSALKFVLMLRPEYTKGILQTEDTLTPLANQVKALVLTIKFDGTKILITTGISYHTFVADKEPEHLWDAAFKRFLSKKNLDFEVL